MLLKKLMKAASLVTYAFLGCLLVNAQESKEALYTMSLAATCASCHGTNGKVVSGSSVAGLAGLPAEHIAEQMRAFKSGARPATVMHQLARGFSDVQIDQMAAYFAAQKK